uniref:DNA polymerase theta-like helix-turn-helix domain-containing protein n=2 Tax=Panagrolaimus sp. JU765 TaxID=591449 RepID=A0AC34RQG8_9BILA
MIGESGRGANLECLIAKYAAAHPRGQIVAMSATIGNSLELATFMKGFHFHNSNRPVELKQYLTIGKTIYKLNNDGYLEEDRFLTSANCDERSGWFFCNSRQACENLALLLASQSSDKLRNHKKSERNQIVEELKAETDNQTAQNLKNVLRCGIAYHHAGLMMCERQVVEAAFHFLQMAGRAGRAGFDDIGECFVIANEKREQVINIIVNEPIPNCLSQLGENLEAFVLDLVGLGFTKKKDVERIVKSSLFGVQNDNVEELLQEVLNDLIGKKFLTIPENDSLGLDFLIYICVPFDVRVQIDWDIYRKQYLKLEPCDRRMFGEEDEVEKRIMRHQQGLEATQTETRLYTALIINRLCRYGMTSLYDNARTFNVAVGWIQQTYESMCHRAQALGRFSEHVTVMWPLKGLLPELVSYMRDAGNEDIAQLMKIDGITRTMAFKLTKTKFNTIGALSQATVDDLRKTLEGRLRQNLAEKIIFNAKCELRNAIDEKREEIAAMGAEFLLNAKEN